MTGRGAGFLLSAALLLPQIASAAPVRVDFAGTVNAVFDGSGLADLFDPPLAPGASFSGSLTFDDAEPPILPGAGEYRFDVPSRPCSGTN